MPIKKKKEVDFKNPEVRKRLLNDYHYYAENALQIKKKSGGFTNFQFNTAQLYVHSMIEKQKQKTGKVRAIILKGRQQGMSTYVEGRFYWLTTHWKGMNTFILTHESKATSNIFNMAKRFYDYSPDQVKPFLSKNNSNELIFGNLGSGYAVGTANTAASGRSMNLQLFHGSEVAYWENEASTVSGVMQSIAEEPGTEVVLESTANGAGGLFYRYWHLASIGEIDFIPIFVPWYWQLEYRREPGIDFERTEEEKEYADKIVKFTNNFYGKPYDITDSQLAWRRAKKSLMLNEETFLSEYPYCPEESFVMSGNHVFNQQDVEVALSNCYPPLYKGDVRKGKIVPHSKGKLSVWGEPDPRESYAIGVDVSEGNANGDYSCVIVLEVTKNYQMAEWHGHIHPHELGDLVCSLAKIYNEAYVGVEINNHGFTTVTRMQSLKYPAHKMYTTKIKGVVGGEKWTRRLGWHTNKSTKKLMIDDFGAEIINHSSGIASKELCDELRTYTKDDKGITGAKSDCYDDRVMARAIAGQVSATYRKRAISKMNRMMNERRQ